MRLIFRVETMWLLVLIAICSSSHAESTYQHTLLAIVLPFSDKSGKDSIGIDGLAIKASMVESLATIKDVHVLFDISQTLSELQKKNDDAIESKDVIKLSSIVKADCFIWGEYDHSSNTIAVCIHIYDPHVAKNITNIICCASDWRNVQQEMVLRTCSVLGIREFSLNQRDLDTVWNINLPARELYAEAVKATKAYQAIEMQEYNLRQAISNNPSYMDAYTALVRRLMIQGFQDSAQAIIDRGLSVNSNCAALYVEKGIILGKQKLFEDAERTLKFATQLDPNEPQAWLALADVEAYRGMVQEAISYYKKALCLNPYGAISCLAKERLNYWKPRQTPVYFTNHLPEIYSNESLNMVINCRVNPKDRAALLNPIIGNDEMKAWAKAQTQNARNKLESCKMLFDALNHHPYGLENKSRTAQEVFALLNQNVPFDCRDFTYLYVALARELSIDAYVVEVFERCDGNKSPHVCSAVSIDGQIVLVDIAYNWFGIPHKSFRILNDLQVISLYLCQTYDLEKCQIANMLSPELDLVKENLITAFMGENMWPQAAEALNSSAPAALPNWVIDCIKAAFELHQNHDGKAVSLLKASVILNPSSGNSWYLLGCAYLKQNLIKEARDSFQRALGCEIQQDCAFQCRDAVAQIDKILSRSAGR